MKQDLAFEAPRTLIVAAAVGWVTVALWLYTPFLSRPYDLVDFFDFLPVLRGSTSFMEAFTGLTSLYADEGRFNVVGFALLGFKWALFGENMLGWQLFRFAEMCLAGALLYHVLRGLSASRVGAIAGCGLLLASPSAAVNWLRLTAGEAVGTILILVLMRLLLRSRDRSATFALLAGLAITTLLLGLVKELLITAIVIPSLVLRQLTSEPSDRGIRAVLRSRRLWAIAAGGSIAALLVLWVALRAPAGAYASRYSLGAVDAGTALMPLVATLLPFAVDDGFTGPALGVAVILFALVMVIGWGILLSPSNKTRERQLLIALGVGLPISGAVVYAPWPSYALMYALPFQVGTAVLLGMAVTALQSSQPARWALGFAMVLPAAVMLSYAHQYSRFLDRSLHMSRDLAVYLGTLPPDQPVGLEVCPGLRPERWTGYGPILMRYAETLGTSTPQLRAQECSLVGASGQSEPRIVLSDAPVKAASQRGRRTYGYRTMDWDRVGPRDRALTVSTFGLPGL